jgi:hypothetical protein
MTLGLAPRQANLFRSTAAYCEGRVAPGSIYGILHRECFTLFPDEMFADLFDDAGRRSAAAVRPGRPWRRRRPVPGSAARPAPSGTARRARRSSSGPSGSRCRHGHRSYPSTSAGRMRQKCARIAPLLLW